MKKSFLVKAAATALIVALFPFATPLAWGFTGPSFGAGVGGGAIGTDAAGSVSIGTPTTAPDTKLLVVASSTDSSNFALRVLQSTNAPILILRNDGSVGIGTASPGSGYTLDIVGNARVQGALNATSYTGTIAAANVTAGVFGSSQGSSPYAFPASLGIATGTQVSLPQSLSVYGGGYFTGNVGIGTTSPGQLLQVGSRGVNNSSGVISLNTCNSNCGGNREWAIGTSYSYFSDENFHIKDTSMGSIALTIAENSGNVGIGTTGPGAKLEVSNGDILFTGIAADRVFRMNQGGTGLGGAGIDYTIASGLMQVYNGPGSEARMVITNSGNVGIGTTGPVAKLQVNGDIIDGGDTAGFGSSYGNSYTNIFTGATVGQVGSIRFFTAVNGAGLTNGIERVRIDSSGNVGIGTAGPGYKLDVQGGQINTSGGLCIAGDCKTSWPAAGTNYWTLSGSNLYPNSTSYNVGIGTTAPGAKLDVAGTLRFASVDCINGSCPANQAIRLTPNLHLNAVGGSAVILNWDNGTTGTTQTLRIGNGAGLDVFWVRANGETYAAGNVGIGTTAPAAQLEISKSGNAELRLTDSGAGGTGVPRIYFSKANAGGATNWSIESGISGADNGVLTFTNTQTANVLNLTKAGNVGIGTTNPSRTLYVAGSGYVRDFLVLGADVSPAQLLHVGGSAYISGNVGIGTTGPSYKLDVVSGGGTTARLGTASGDSVVIGGGAGKVTAGTYDPLYTIGGKNYATYLPGITGQKEETTGIVELGTKNSNSGIMETTIDFGNAAQGSDLWLFSKATDLKNNLDKLVVLLTPAFDGKVWYEKDKNNMKLTIFATPSTTYYSLPTTYEISYRLSAPRFDAANWPNYSSDRGTGLTPPNE